MLLAAPRVLYSGVYHKPTSLFLSSQMISSKWIAFAELTRTFVFKAVAPCSLLRLLYRQHTSEVARGLGLHERSLLGTPPNFSIARCVSFHPRITVLAVPSAWNILPETFVQVSSPM